MCRHADAITMVDAGAQMVSEDVMLEAFGLANERSELCADRSSCRPGR